jgi:hypothetical protein
MRSIRTGEGFRSIDRKRPLIRRFAAFSHKGRRESLA